MTYQVLARKYRPQDFSSVVGQKPIVTALRNALTDGRIAQAYLFSGIRGVGKTSVARILAKALNCERGPAADPCNECAACVEITRGDDFDVLEFDAATHSKVDQVRELTESLKYGPGRNRYKVIILDEIHRLSRQAFDALLKIVEEPPAHLVFIFATTEAESVPATLLSRCQEFRFRRVPLDELAAHLETISKQESISASPAALRLIARAGDGSVRDAVALVDQLATFGSGDISDDDAASLLGGLGFELLRTLLAATLEGRSEEVSQMVAEIDNQGWDPRHVYGEFLAYCRTALRLGLNGDPARTDLPREEAVTLAELTREVGYENLLRILHLLLESEATVRRSESGSLAVEVAWLRAAELPKLIRVEEILAGREPSGSGDSGVSAKRQPPRPSKPAPTSRATTSKKEKPAEIESPPADLSRGGGKGPSPSNVDTEPGTVTALLERLGRQKQSLAAHLGEAEELILADGVLTIVATPGDQWLHNTLARESNSRHLEGVIAEVWGPGVTWRLTEGKGNARQEEKKPEEPPADETLVSALEDPRVQAVLDIFGGSVESVDKRDTPEEAQER
ncbi:MAG: DNA polymerase III subunit gamma/tau [Acidobacteriota bacterium]|nr:DNA polymerase III subunit gamma/tau [Acidobacteriota bacterium]